MSAFLIVDIDDIIEYLDAQSFAPNLLDVAMSLRNTAALAVGLSNPNELTAIAVANWNKYSRADSKGINVQQIFVSTGYDLFNVAERKFIVDALLTDYFPLEAEASIDELILASSKPDLLRLLERLSLKPHVRVRVWADVQPPIKGHEFIFQKLESILGVKTKSVALYIDFENIAISLNEQGYIVDLDILINALKTHTSHYGQVVHMAAYAPWGQRGSLPPMLDPHGREISDDVPSRLALESIDPVFSLPGKNSADLRIAKDVLAESSAPNSPEIVIIASGDRDFNDIYNALRARGKQVVVWGVRGSTSRVLENNTAIKLEYIDDFAIFRRHNELVTLFDDHADEIAEEPDFRPSQWSSLVLQYDILQGKQGGRRITRTTLAQQLDQANTTANYDRALDLIDQAIKIGILSHDPKTDAVKLRLEHPVVAQTHLIRDHIVNRVKNTLEVRNWDYVNYGFLLKGIAMDDKLNQPGINLDDNWRSEWIDFFVREGILVRELIPHRHNPDDLVPVISVSNLPLGGEEKSIEEPISASAVQEMAYRIVVSVEQFTSFRKFMWCPLGSLHKRLRAYDESTAFQEAVEMLERERAIELKEYPNPQSTFMTKGISLVMSSPLIQRIIDERNDFIRTLLTLHDQRQPITRASIKAISNYTDREIQFWISVMQLENVLNPIPGQFETYSLFRTHHTVNQVAGNPA